MYARLQCPPRTLALPAAAPASRMIPASCGSPGREPWNPARDVGPEILVLGAKALSQHRLLVNQDKAVEREPQEPAVNQETPVAEQDPLAQDDRDDGDVDRIAGGLPVAAAGTGVGMAWPHRPHLIGFIKRLFAALNEALWFLFRS